MGDFKMGSKTVMSQSGTSNPTFGSGAPTGCIIQVQFTQYTGTASMTSIGDDTNYVLVDGAAGSGTEILNVNITPKSTSSKIWLQCSWTGEFNNMGDVYNSIFFFYRDSTTLVAPSASNRLAGIMPPAINYDVANAGSTLESCFYQYFDAPSTTSQITYKAGVIMYGNATTLHTNRTVDDTDNNSWERGISSICAIEIAG